MHEAAICKQGDHHIRGHDGTHLIENWLVGFKTDLGTPMTECSPSERNGATTIHKGGTDQDKRGEGSPIQGGIPCAALKHLSPRAQSHRVGQANANNSPGQSAQAANIMVGRSRYDGKQPIQEIVMYLFSFVHGGTSMNPFNRSSTLIPFFRSLKFVSQSGGRPRRLPYLHVMGDSDPRYPIGFTTLFQFEKPYPTF